MDYAAANADALHLLLHNQHKNIQPHFSTGNSASEAALTPRTCAITFRRSCVVRQTSREASTVQGGAA
jgi:hypothetical protein